MRSTNYNIKSLNNLTKKNFCIYICGQVGDLTDDVYYNSVVAKFNSRERELRKIGYKHIVNPTRIVKRGTDWQTAMRICLSRLMECTHISPLPDTQRSQGAKIEFYIAVKLGHIVVIPSKINRRRY